MLDAFPHAFEYVLTRQWAPNCGDMRDLAFAGSTQESLGLADI